MDRTEIIKDVREHAWKNYEGGGWDILVECWSDEDILQNMGNATTARDAIWAIAKVLQTLDEHRQEIQSTYN